MHSFLRSCVAKLKRKLRRRERKCLGSTPIFGSSPSEPLSLLQRERNLSTIFEHELHLTSGNPKPKLLLLPYEIRRQIVEYCLCGIALHLDLSEHRHIKHIINYNIVRPKRHLLSIPLTCRQLCVYISFSINILQYTKFNAGI